MSYTTGLRQPRGSRTGQLVGQHLIFGDHLRLTMKVLQIASRPWLASAGGVGTENSLLSRIRGQLEDGAAPNEPPSVAECYLSYALQWRWPVRCKLCDTAWDLPTAGF